MDQPGQTLDDTLQEAALRDPKALPLLQFTLNKLFVGRGGGRVLAFEAYRAMGGLEGALASYAEDTLKDLPPSDQAALPSLLRALVTVGRADVEPVVVRRVPLATLRRNPLHERLLEKLIDARLLVTDQDDSMQPVVAIAHEALLTHWSRLKNLLEKDRDFFRLRSRVADAAERWQKENRPTSALLPGGLPVIEARELLKSRRSDLDADLVEFIERSVNYRIRQKKRLNRLIASLTLGILCAMSVVPAVVYVKREKELAQAQITSVEARGLRESAEGATKIASLERQSDTFRREAARERAKMATLEQERNDLWREAKSGGAKMAESEREVARMTNSLMAAPKAARISVLVSTDAFERDAELRDKFSRAANAIAPLHHTKIEVQRITRSTYDEIANMMNQDVTPERRQLGGAQITPYPGSDRLWEIETGSPDLYLTGIDLVFQPGPDGKRNTVHHDSKDKSQTGAKLRYYNPGASPYARLVDPADVDYPSAPRRQRPS